ncbi:hypothetical protein DPMN_103396 [Dreissena polymorpha]|uniref:Uncharacterized protein n=1 Tax=Dreissena polymorpha TaxID=45954 RepID=A0A9D4H9Z1_DREPO|nr:hypothetical protein DPMN_103396 [Dreissena polymorpha]
MSNTEAPFSATIWRSKPPSLFAVSMLKILIRSDSDPSNGETFTGRRIVIQTFLLVK